MKTVVAIAAEEWRHWRRSKLAVVAAVILGALLVTTTLATLVRMEDERRTRLRHQQAAEEAFTSQPDRHPHRMVHYGHFVFRLPTPLSTLDPGVDPVTGQAMFLEGHRQNSATGSNAHRSAFLGDLSLPTPAFLYQFFAPLLLILLGYATFVRERESRTLVALLAQGISGRAILLGKWAALLLAAVALQVPAALVGLYALSEGEPLATVLALQGSYLAFLLLWTGLIVAVSALSQSRSASLAALLAVWMVTTLIVPGFAVNWITSTNPSPGKIATDLAMKDALNEVGDGHDASDPAFDAFRANVLAQYGVERIEDLPVNWRGMVAERSEAELTDLMQRYAEQQLTLEVEQADTVMQFGWLSPYLLMSRVSRVLAGTDLATHHRFLREAERVRFDFVQSLNRAHAEQMAYADDINRSRDAASERRTRISAENWKVVGEFEFQPDPAPVRLQRAAPGIAILMVWMVASLLAPTLISSRLGIR